MIIDYCEQGSDEWFEKRCGIPSASKFDKIVTSKGESSKSVKDYMHQLIAERIIGEKTVSFQSASMLKGIENEPEARALYEFKKGVEVEKVGLCYKDESKLYSCSPDGIVGQGGLEIKCPENHTHIGYLLGGKLPTKYVQQVQGSLFITGLEWWDFMSYAPGIKPLIVRVFPDIEFHKKLDIALKKLCASLEETYLKLVS